MNNHAELKSSTRRAPRTSVPDDGVKRRRGGRGGGAPGKPQKSGTEGRGASERRPRLTPAAHSAPRLNGASLTRTRAIGNDVRSASRHLVARG